jgi:hypothetical protein
MNVIHSIVVSPSPEEDKKNVVVYLNLNKNFRKAKMLVSSLLL